MITPREVEERVRHIHEPQIGPAEKQIDAELVAGYDNRYSGITVTLNPPVHRLILDELAKKYRGKDKWTVDYVSSKRNDVYDGLRFKVFSESRSSEL